MGRLAQGNPDWEVPGSALFLHDVAGCTRLYESSYWRITLKDRRNFCIFTSECHEREIAGRADYGNT